jgi:hypothetical protein
LSFAYTCDTTKEKSGKQGLIEAVQFFFMSMKKSRNQSNWASRC